MLGVASCTHEGPTTEPDDPVLVELGDTTLRLSQVTALIPEGLSEEDSLAMYGKIIDRWMRDALLREVADENIPDIRKIDRLTEQYRNDLIINEYLARISSQRGDAATEEKVRAFYEAGKQDMKLEKPLVKGIFIKLPADAVRLDEVRRWVKSSSRSSIDNIEKYGLKGAIQYEYFLDRWVEMSSLAEAIPHSFGNLDEWLVSHKDLDITSNGSTYLLHITDRLESGAEMPYDFASPQIRQTLMQRNRAEYADRLLSSLIEKGRNEGILKTPGYDPSSHKIITNPENKNK